MLFSQANSKIYMRKQLILSLLSISLVFNSYAGSEDFDLSFQSRTIPTKADFKESKRLVHDPSEVVNGRYFRIIQFDKIPDDTQKSRMEKLGLEFLLYQPQNAYLVSIPAGLKKSQIEDFNIRSIIQYRADWKIHADLGSGIVPDHAKAGGNKMFIQVSFPPQYDPESFSQRLEAEGYELVPNTIGMESVGLVVKSKDVESIAALPYVYFISYPSVPGEPENNTARTLIRSNAISPDYGASRNFDGTGVNIYLQDNSPLGDHIDHFGRIDNSLFGSGFVGTHGSHVSGTMLGAGNLNPLMEGVARGAFAYNDNYDVFNYLSELPGLVQDSGVVITQASYGNGCNAGYTQITRSLDLQVNASPQLVHVFSTGNSGTSSCGIIQGWGNITGGHKSGKNQISTAALDLNGVRVGFSSRGPATDGRIKPDIATKGGNVMSTGSNNSYYQSSGTSMASPGASGVMAQLYQAYREMNNGTNPSSGLIKSIVLNTADDIGNPGPDFSHGWGQVNAIRAVESLENMTYFTDSASQGDSLVYTLTVPAGLSQLRVMVYWPDVAGAINANPALVNDLEFRLYNPSNTEYEPWILNTTPTAAALNSPATRGADHLNNMEQVTLLNPSAGTYTIVVKGHSVPFGPQPFFVNHVFDNDDVKVTFPVGRESFDPGENILIRWDAFGNSGTFNVEYTLDSGQTWSTISGSVAANRRYLNWTTPNTASPYAMVRVTRGADVGVSERPFYIMETPGGLNWTAGCPDSAQLSWTATTSAFGYVGRVLGDKYMDSVGYTTTNSIWLPIPSTSTDSWATVNAVAIGDIKSRRALAIQSVGGIYNCAESPAPEFSSNNTNVCVGKTVTLEDETPQSVTTYQWSISPSTFQFVNGTSASSANPDVQFLALDNYDVTLQGTNSNGTGSTTKNSYIQTLTGDQTPLNEDFESGSFPPANWEIENPDDNLTWVEGQSIIDINGSPSTVSWINFFDQVSGNEINELKTKILDLTGYTNPLLLFDLAHALRVPTIGPTLRVKVSDDCGENFVTSSYERSGLNLATTSTIASGSPWFPQSGSDWGVDSVRLDNWKESEVQISFETQSAILGNNLFIDNIRIVEGGPNALEGLTDDQKLKVYPNPASGSFRVHYEGKEEILSIRMLEITGKELEVNTTAIQNGLEVDLKNLSSGTYILVVLTNENQLIRKIGVE